MGTTGLHAVFKRCAIKAPAVEGHLGQRQYPVEEFCDVHLSCEVAHIA
jgi:hypothetical protein